MMRIDTLRTDTTTAQMHFEERYRKYKSQIDRYLNAVVTTAKPRSLYQPMEYVLRGGGKRIRPVLVLLACEAVGGNAEEAMHASAATEILHNFTLVHDDIMDHADARRGKATVHTRWDTNVAILAGDALLALAYRTLLKTKSPHIQRISKVFTEGILEVCEGQAYDKEFEVRTRVRVEEYMMMIEKKTGAMAAAAAEIGALIGNASGKQLKALRQYGRFVGRAFQVQDDLLDIVGDEKRFGKSIGGDLQEGKKTFLLLEALRRAHGSDRRLLHTLISNGGVARGKVKEFRRIYLETGAIDAARERIAHDLSQAKRMLHHLPDTEARAMLQWLADMLFNRTS
jgi:geranylgeranyl diphosphate synthase type II